MAVTAEQAAEKTKNDCYYDSQNGKVKDNNAVEVAEYYMRFLHDKYSRPDLPVDFELLVEVKGVNSPNPSQAVLYFLMIIGK